MATPTAAAMTVFRLVFNVPKDHLAACKKAIFAAGAGALPPEQLHRFRPGDAARPHLGAVGQLEQVPETRVETPCVGKDVAKKAIEALKKAHPYEEPSYQLYKVEDLE
ncbi:structural toxin protein RtxA [Apiospora kogelbergensis]|uniref:structural toxin protein RtxA n=1 Tax=Apiospora kogelbergensis TaxID=1337665 RepID=UPI00312DC5BB